MQKIILFFGQVDKQENKPHSHPRGIHLNAPNWNTNRNALSESFIKATAMKMEYIICHYIDAKIHNGNILKLCLVWVIVHFSMQLGGANRGRNFPIKWLHYRHCNNYHGIHSTGLYCWMLNLVLQVKKITQFLTLSAEDVRVYTFFFAQNTSSYWNEKIKQLQSPGTLLQYSANKSPSTYVKQSITDRWGDSDALLVIVKTSHCVQLEVIESQDQNACGKV